MYITKAYRSVIETNENVINNINKINILDVLKVDGYCIFIENSLLTYVYAKDIAIGAGLNKEEEKFSTTSGRKSYDNIRWNRFIQYFNETVEELQMVNPDILRFIQPLDINSYILLEVALGILNRCNNTIAKKFRATLMFKVVPIIQQQAINEYMQQIGELNTQLDNKKNIIDEYERNLKTAVDSLQRQKYAIELLSDMKNVTEDDIKNAIGNMSIKDLINIFNK